MKGLTFGGVVGIVTSPHTRRAGQHHKGTGVERFGSATRRAGVRVQEPRLRERFLLFRIGDEVYGMGIQGLQEVLLPDGATILARSSHQLCVSVVHRGRSIPVLRMWLLFGDTRTEASETARVLLAKGKTRSFGLLVDEVLEMVEVDGSQIAPLPTLATILDPACFRGVITHQERVVLLVSEDGLDSLDEVILAEKAGR